MQGHVRGGCGCGGGGAEKEKESKAERRRRGNRGRMVERRMNGEGGQVGVCPCAGTTDCTVLYRATSRNQPPFPSPLFSIPYSFDSPSASTLSSYIRLFHNFFSFSSLSLSLPLSSIFFFCLSLRFSVYIFPACFLLSPVLLSVLSLLRSPMMQPADSQASAPS